MWKQNESGQSLLVIVLLISIVFTIIATASYRLTTETQSTRLQEESIKTLAAADAGIERGVNYAYTHAETPYNPTTGNQKVTYSSLGINLPGVNSTKSTLEVTATEGVNFLSPLIPKDEEYTYYLYEYPTGTTSITGSLYLYFAKATCAAPTALEITTIYGATGTSIARSIADPCNLIPTGAGELATSTGTTIDGTTLQYRVTVPGYTQSKIMVIRVLGTATNIGFVRAAGGTLFSQGQLIRSEAVSNNGVTKLVTLFKSYPQIPADFFVTRF